MIVFLKVNGLFRETRRAQCGFTLIELLIAMAVIAALAAISLSSYSAYVERARASQAIKDIAEISQHIERYHTENGTYPASLAALGETRLDPWGHTYLYLAIDVVPPPNVGLKRRDKNLNPLNSDYDLYSLGPDGMTQKQLTAANAKDDIVRAGNGGFIGKAEDF